jgi:hypothetical protein
MLSAKEILEQCARNSGTPNHELFRELLEASSANGTKEPLRVNVIVGSPWPSKVPGATLRLCQLCGQEVALSPASGLRATQMFTQAQVMCLDCALKSAIAEEAARGR